MNDLILTAKDVDEAPSNLESVLYKIPNLS